MKKLLSLMLLCTLLLTLAACGHDKDDSAPAPTGTPAPEEVLAASATNTAQSQQNHAPPASGTDTVVLDQDAYGKALGYVGQPTSALFAAIGQPFDSAYSASCEEEGAEDGMLYYNGFSVWTMRTATGEIVRAVYLDE